jgi:hypothetical protein
VFGNTWDSYPAASKEYLNRLYPAIFSKSDIDRGTVGQILQEVALRTKLEKRYVYRSSDNAYDSHRANVHQVLLQGDPALRILMSVPLATTPQSTRISSDEDSSEQQVDDQISASPNPNDGKFDLRFYVQPGKAALLTILSQTGAELLSKNFIGHGQHLEPIQLNSAATGIVLIQLRTNDRIQAKKIIIVK